MRQAYPSLAVGGRWVPHAHLMGPKLLYVVVPPLALSVGKVGLWKMGGKVGGLDRGKGVGRIGRMEQDEPHDP